MATVVNTSTGTPGFTVTAVCAAAASSN
jgi:hypothetical protein